MADLKLGPLQDNGGPTHTHLPAEDSVAVDNSQVQAAACPATDQRGVPRPIGLGCDTGAVERGYLLLFPLTQR